MYTVTKKRPPFYISNNFVKNLPILVCEILRKFDIDSL